MEAVASSSKVEQAACAVSGCSNVIIGLSIVTAYGARALEN